MFSWATFLISVQLKQKETKTLNASALASCDSAAQWDIFSGTISCSANCSYDAIVDCNHSWHNDSLSSDDACLS